MKTYENLENHKNSKILLKTLKKLENIENIDKPRNEPDKSHFFFKYLEKPCQ